MSNERQRSAIIQSTPVRRAVHDLISCTMVDRRQQQQCRGVPDEDPDSSLRRRVYTTQLKIQTHTHTKRSAPTGARSTNTTHERARTRTTRTTLLPPVSVFDAKPTTWGQTVQRFCGDGGGDNDDVFGCVYSIWWGLSACTRWIQQQRRDNADVMCLHEKAAQLPCRCRSGGGLVGNWCRKDCDALMCVGSFVVLGSCWVIISHIQHSIFIFTDYSLNYKCRDNWKYTHTRFIFKRDLIAHNPSIYPPICCCVQNAPIMFTHQSVAVHAILLVYRSNGWKSKPGSRVICSNCVRV